MDYFILFFISQFRSLSFKSTPSIQKSLYKYIQAPSQQPSLFLFDIQENQVTDLKNLLKKHNI